MPRITQVKKARKDQGTCSCGHEIKAGDSYKWIEFRYGGRRVKCERCNFRASELTQSKLSEVYAAQEGLTDFLDGWDTVDAQDVRDEAEQAMEQIRAVGEEYQAAADAIREVADGEVADQNEEKANELESWADELDSAISGIDDFEGAVDDDGESTDDAEASEWRDNVKCELSVFDDCPL